MIRLLEAFVNELHKSLISQSLFEPLPKYFEREQWEKIDSDTKKAFISQAEQYFNFNWPPLSASLYIEYKINGNRSHFEKEYFLRRHALGTLVIAECIEGQGRFLIDIINGIWAICEESTWTVPAHLSKPFGANLPLPEYPIIDLFAADTAQLLSICYYLLEDVILEKYGIVLERVEYELKHRILDEYLENNDYNWMGFKGNKINNWNPWINANILTVFLLIEQDNTRRVNGITKIMKSLDNFIGQYGEDGGCDEGPTYWTVAGAKLLDALDMLYRATSGKINIFDNDLIKNMGKYFLRVHIGDDLFVNFADAHVRVKMPGSVVYRYGVYIGDYELTTFGKQILNLPAELAKQDWCEIGRLLLTQFFDLKEPIFHSITTEKIENFFFFRDIQVLVTRSPDQKCFLAVKGGHNNESHNHNDVGNYMIFYENFPMIIDAGVGEYTAATFGANRYNIWTMQSAYHNCPTINSMMQQKGLDFRATDVKLLQTDDTMGLSMELKDAYPLNAEINTWIREIRLNWKKEPIINVREKLHLKKRIGETYITLMTLGEPQILKNSILFMEKLSMSFDADKLTPKAEPIFLNDLKLEEDWKSKMLYRIIFTLQNGITETELIFTFKKI